MLPLGMSGGDQESVMDVGLFLMTVMSVGGLSGTVCVCVRVLVCGRTVRDCVCVCVCVCGVL